MQTAADPVSAYPNESVRADDLPASAVSWPAIAAGTAVAAAASLVLVTLGAGIGFAALSPWPHAGASATGFTMMMAIAYILVQWLSAAIGGYRRLCHRQAAHEMGHATHARGLLS